MTDRRTDRRTDGGDCNIPDAFLKKRGDNKRSCGIGVLAPHKSQINCHDQ